MVAECNHLTEFPGGIDMKQRKRRLPWIELLQRQTQKNGRISADRIEHHRVVTPSDSLANDVDAFGFELLKMRQWCGAMAFAGRSSASDRRLSMLPILIIRLRIARGSGRHVGWPAPSPHSVFSSCSHHQRPARSAHRMLPRGCKARSRSRGSLDPAAGRTEHGDPE